MCGADPRQTETPATKRCRPRSAGTGKPFSTAVRLFSWRRPTVEGHHQDELQDGLGAEDTALARRPPSVLPAVARATPVRCWPSLVICALKRLRRTPSSSGVRPFLVGAHRCAFSRGADRPSRVTKNKKEERRLVD